MYKHKTLLKNIDGNFYSYIHFIIELFFMLLVAVASDSKLWVESTMDVFMEVAFRPSTADFVFP